MLSTRSNRSSVPGYGLIEGGFKVVLDREGAVRVFDVATGDDVTSSHTERAARDGERLRDRKRRAAGLAERSGRSPLTEDAEEELRALGYVR